MLSNNVNIEIKYSTSSSNLNDIFTSNFYTGFVDDEQSSSVLIYYDHDQIIKNKTIIYGKIEIGSETFYIEVSSNASNLNILNTHSILFLAS